MNNMKRDEKIEFVKSLVDISPDGISIDHLHVKCSRILTRDKLRALLSFMYLNKLISKERVKVYNKKEARYFPFNGKATVKRKRKVKKRVKK